MKRKVIVLVLIQILILVGIGVWQWNQELHEYRIDGSTLTSEIGTKMKVSYRIDESDPAILEEREWDEEKEAFWFAKGSVPFVERGSYELTIQYDTDIDGNQIEVQNWEYPSNLLMTEPLLLSPQSNQMKTMIWTECGMENLEVRAFYKGEGSLEIGSIHFVETRDKIGQDLFRIFRLFLIIDAIFWVKWYWKKYPSNTKEGKQKRWTVLILAGTMFFLCLPLTSNLLISMEMEDLDYHLARIVGMKSALREGQFPIRIHSALNWEFGYASPIFYPELFLYPSAILHAIGLPLMQSYKVFVFLMNGMTVLISYFCIKKMFQSRWIGLIGSMAYSLSYYRLINVYLRAAVGEAMAITFFPMIVYGLYRIYTMDTKERAYRFVWIVPAFGYAGLIQSHMISCELVGVITLIVCALLLRSTLERKRFLALCKTAIMAVLLNLWFLVPMLQSIILAKPALYFMGQDMRGIQQEGLTLSNLFHLFFVGNKNESGYYLGLGAVLTIVFFGFLAIICIWDKKEKNNRYYRLGKWFFGLGSFALICTLTIFPWDFIRKLGIIGEILTKFRISSRYLSLATLFFSFLGCCLISLLLKKYPMRKKQIFTVSAAAILFFTAQFLDTLQSVAPTIQIFSGANQVSADWKNLGWGGEYVPYDLNGLETIEPNRRWEEQTGVISYQKSGTKIVLHAINPNAETIAIQMPLIYYQGYCAETKDGQRLDVYGGKDGKVTIGIPAGYEGTIGIWYRGFWYWDVALGISIVTLVVMIWIGIRQRIQNQSQHF